VAKEERPKRNVRRGTPVEKQERGGDSGGKGKWKKEEKIPQKTISLGDLHPTTKKLLRGNTPDRVAETQREGKKKMREKKSKKACATFIRKKKAQQRNKG